MPNWFINSVAAQLLYEKHGLRGRGLFYIREVPTFSGLYWFDFISGNLRKHPKMTRKPRYQLSPDNVLELMLLPDEDSRDAYIKAVGFDSTLESPSDS